MSKLSEDEIIEGITKMLNECDKYFDDYGIYLHLAGKKEQDLVRGLLDLYQKEKEKNRLLIEGKFREVADKNSYIKDNYISKDKIREFKNKFIKDSKNEKVFMTQSSQINASLIQFCNELLEERN